VIRKARLTDVKAIHALVNAYALEGQLLPRALTELYECLRDFYVWEEEGRIVGVCGLHVAWEDLAEVRSLAVDSSAKGRGIGRALVERCLEEARDLAIPRIFALTYQEGFFSNLGFVEVDKQTLPQKIWADCLKCVKFPDCDETAMMLELAPSRV
jgi:amino-acid N-acetyltransferase